MHLNVQKNVAAHASAMNSRSFSFDQKHGAMTHSIKFLKHFLAYLQLILKQNTQIDLELPHGGVIMFS